MKIYTRTGDDGQTALFGGPRVPKDMVRVEAYGAVDELNAVLGLVRTEPLADVIDRVLARIQNELFEVGAEIASPDPVAKGTRTIGQTHVKAIEDEIDRHESGLAPLEHFILPGGTRGAALLHVARTVCRRAERRLVALMHDDPEKVSPALMAYLNRLSDLLFVLARAANAQAGRQDVIWPGGARNHA
ncbi:MAG: cob(I)yrinic acid a,c-diamide adenosyltransferase [Thermoguttaceae bacterium]|jgi:cob(I)alamin adenosyltransferase|nr:cob(I)yrinic acid a,c-diamide adenosyltransferase [Thermoguttaceae bacterium]